MGYLSSTLIMKTFTALILVLTVSTVSSYHIAERDVAPQGYAEFIAKVKEIYGKFKENGIEFVCSSKLEELLELLGIPDDLDGAVHLAQKWACGGDPEELAKRAELELQERAWADFIDKAKSAFDKLKEKTKTFVCSAKLQQLMDMLDVSDDLDGAIAMAQDWVCGADEITVQALWDRLKTFSYNKVCSANLMELMDLLGVPDSLDGPTLIAQHLMCH